MMLPGPAIPCPQPHLARYAVPPERKLMMLIAIGKTMGKSPFSYMGKCPKLLVIYATYGAMDPFKD